MQIPKCSRYIIDNAARCKSITKSTLSSRSRRSNFNKHRSAMIIVRIMLSYVHRIKNILNNAYGIKSICRRLESESGSTFLIDLHGNPARRASRLVSVPRNSLIIRFHRSKLSVGMYTRIWKVNPVARR